MTRKKVPCYRRIWEKIHGPIPVDSDGRTYEIHHLDGDRANNDISNLVCVSIKEHYEIHYKQGDWAACLSISARAKISPEEKSRLAKKVQKEKVENGTHHFLGPENNLKRIKEGTHQFLGSEKALQRNQRRLEEGTHNWQKDENGESDSSRRVKAGTHHFVTNNPGPRMIEEGRHASKIRLSCIRCQKTTTKNLFTRQHARCWEEKFHTDNV